MPTPGESRAALILVTSAAVEDAGVLVASLGGGPDAKRDGLLEAVPGLVAYYADGSSALAADLYDDERERAGARGRFVAEPVVPDRAEKIRRGVLWAAGPLFQPSEDTVEDRLAKVVQLETAKPYRETIVENRRRDPAAVGWRRVAEGGCKFCAMLADRGAVYKEATARFAAHSSCKCTAAPVFDGEGGEEASVVQYVASKKRRSAKENARVREYLNANYPDFHG